MAVRKKIKARAIAIAADEPVTANAEVLTWQKPFNKELFFSFRYADLFVDVLLFLFSIFVSDKLFSGEGLFTQLKGWQIVAMYCVVILTLPYYLGYLYEKSKVFYSKFVMKVILWIFILITAAILVNLVRLVFQMDLESKFLDGKSEFFAAFAMFLIILGPMMSIGGSIAANAERASKDGEEGKFASERMAPMGALLVIVLAIAFMLYFIGIFPGDSWWAVLVAYLGGPFAAVIVYGIFLAFLAGLDKLGIYKYLAFFAKHTFPMFIVCVLVFWSGVSIYFMKSDFGDGGKISVAATIFSVCISGLVPFRLILMFDPPWRIVHIISGVISMWFFFFSLSKIVA